MKAFYYLSLIAILSACAQTGDLNFPYRDSSSGQNPSNPMGNFNNDAVNNNKKLTSMYSRNKVQVEKYINYRLNQWSNYNPSVGNNIDRLDIANAALWLTSGNKTTTEIENQFKDNMDLFHMAVYVIDNRLNRCFGNTSAAYSADCFVKWRDGNENSFNSIANNLLNNAVLLSADQAVIKTVDDVQISFTVESDGTIAKVTLDDGLSTKTFNNIENGNQFYNIEVDNEDFVKNTLTYNSVGKELGLSYSDFGFYNITNNNQITNEVLSTIESNILFMGGYPEQEIAAENISQDLEFSGKALANVTKGENTMNLTDDTAVLNFNKESGTSTLTASFDNWYDVEVNGSNITFSNYKPNTNKYDMQLNTAANEDGIVNVSDATTDINYYASVPENNIPTEAVGMVKFDEGADGVNMDMVFGVKGESSNISPNRPK